MAEKDKKEITEVRAFARGIHVSPKKARLVVRVLKNMPVAEAKTTLKFLTKRATLPIAKLLDSAIANAGHNFQIEPDNLYVKSITVDGGRVYFRYQPRAQGRAMPVRKRTSNFNLILGVRKAQKKVKKAVMPEKMTTFEQKLAVTQSKDLSPIATGAATGAKVEKKSRFAFWRKDKISAGKPDTKGKAHTTYDRRSGS